MKDVNANWFIRYGWLTGKPDWQWGGNRNSERVIVISLCGTFWRAVRTTVFLSIPLTLLLLYIRAWFVQPWGTFGLTLAAAIALAFAAGMSMLTDIIRERNLRKRAERMQTASPKPPNPYIRWTTDIIWAVKNKICPLYRVTLD